MKVKMHELVARIEQLELTVTELVAKREADQYMINLVLGGIAYGDPGVHAACMDNLERFADGYAEQSMQMTRQQNPDMTEAERVACEMEFEITQSTLLDYLESQRSDDPDRPTFSVIEGGKRD